MTTIQQLFSQDKSTGLYPIFNITLTIILLALSGCSNDADWSQKVNDSINNGIETLANNSHLGKIQTIDIEGDFIITKSGLVLDNQKIDADVVGNSIGVCLRFDNKKLPYQHLSEVDDWTNRINLKAIVVLENNPHILLTKSARGLIATSTEDRIKPDDYVNICLSNHHINPSLVGQKVKQITITADENLYIENIQWGSS
ncbi:hypothetical protein [Psychrobacter sp. I-STPA6b]|uniref:hypothetical protein n=1 Tax=Psychrobacter sp. I-STPA6b TaxID=2585718 RepID=UPI001D0CDB9B|nr:hypothetical protein [Psychrobacter sp. I-STPA6b]